MNTGGGRGGLAGFVGRFADLSRGRIVAARATFASASEPVGEVERSARELHSMAGEAGLLGMTEVMAFARAAEQAAAALASEPSPDRREAALAALDDLETALRNAMRAHTPDPS